MHIRSCGTAHSQPHKKGNHRCIELEEENKKKKKKEKKKNDKTSKRNNTL
jgi:CDGSH-type Zn-finger protein